MRKIFLTLLAIILWGAAIFGGFYMAYETYVANEAEISKDLESIANSPFIYWGEEEATPPENEGGEVTTPPENEGGDVTTPPESEGGDVTTPPESEGGDVTTPPESEGDGTVTE